MAWQKDMAMHQQNHSFWGRFSLAAFGVVILLAGCAPSTSSVIGMRHETDLVKSRKNQVELLDYVGMVGEPGDRPKWTKEPIWRIEAIRTMCHVDARLGYARIAPEMHQQLVAFLKKEYETSDALSKKHTVRAWCIYGLGEVAGAESIPYFVRVLEDNTFDSDRDYKVSLATLHSLYPGMARLQTDPALRKRVLRKLAIMDVDMKKGRVSIREMTRLRPAVISFERNLKGYVVVVALLPDSASRTIDDPTLLRILDWNYQHLAVGDHRKADAASKAAFGTNVASLLLLAWDKSPPVRTKSRLILAEFAPLALFDALADKMIGGQRVDEEDYVHFVNLLPTVDALMSPSSGRPNLTHGKIAAYSQRREMALANIFARIGGVTPKGREIIYSRLLEHDVIALARGLLSANTTVLSEKSPKVLQQLRYMGHLFKYRKIGADKDLRRRIAAAIGSYCVRRDILIRKQIAAHLLLREPAILAVSCAPALKRISADSPATAEYLLDTYMAALERIESRSRKDPYSEDMRADFGGHPYILLAHGIRRSEMRIRGKVARFLLRRDSDFLIGLLAADLKRKLDRAVSVRDEEFVLLGDLLQRSRARLKPPALAQGVGVIRRGLASKSEEQALLCVRYLVELDQPISPKESRNLPASAKALLQLAQKASRRAAR
jgi:hypothetical protein